jgi:hypothetical protein
MSSATVAGQNPCPPAPLNGANDDEDYLDRVRPRSWPHKVSAPAGLPLQANGGARRKLACSAILAPYPHLSILPRFRSCATDQDMLVSVSWRSQIRRSCGREGSPGAPGRQMQS